MKFLFIMLLLFNSALLQAADWQMVWNDEFDYTGLPDSTKWDYEDGFKRNQEEQYYTVGRPENARVEDGLLIIEARKETYKDAEYTSASLHTFNTTNWTYGRIEVRAKIPTGKGTWPAIWMLGMNKNEAGWPLCGEIDIMENVGYDPDEIWTSIHTKAYNHIDKTGKNNHKAFSAPYDRFYVYAIEWYPDRIVFFVDNEKVFTFSNDGTGDPETWPFDQPYYLILNLAIGGTWGGQQGIDSSLFPHRYYIDYVRVFKNVAIE